MHTPSQAISLIQTALKEGRCTELAPHYDMIEKEWRNTTERKKRQEGNILRLQSLISQVMQERHKESLIDTLENKAPIIYIDALNKWGLDILIHLIKTIFDASSSDQKDEILKDSIKRSMFEWLKEFTKTYNGDQYANDLFSHYITLSTREYEQMDANQPWASEMTKNFENDFVYRCIAELMESEKKKIAYVYLDNTQALSLGENERINSILQRRGNITHHEDREKLLIKINNGTNARATWNAPNGLMVECPHDISSTLIKEEDVVSFTSAD